MVRTLKKHKIYFGILIMFILALILALNFLLKVEEIPSKGIFVMGKTILLYGLNTI
ncbi:UNVERIFIED_CONTAM: hypothetical protein Cloal_2928 [Acetivibrio alkalicellulosi]